VAKALDRWRSALFERIEKRLPGPCPHVGLPVSTIIEAWKPEEAMCGACTLRRGRDTTLSGKEELTCDGCGHIGDHIHMVAANLGVFLFVGGLCCDCLERQGQVCTTRQDQAVVAAKAGRHAAIRQEVEYKTHDVAKAVAKALPATGAERISALRRLRSIAVQNGDDRWASWARQELRKARKRES
jgi:hypothetical protein